MDTETLYCPNCDYRLQLQEYGAAYAILDNGQAVTSCPNCLIPLRVEDGKLVEDKS